ncbi:Transducin/WD40 repeat-like superfamily protein [Rhynchospora pubera]|uniref:Transducin/WD40 repeat-like superfamily protein n=1 Tax=Rhynchospora pubera TaxID=906938 RepID=A0AAV8BUW6_9POAL|nr:Transducin/WD40 repeat-like superfamily protein [Rhynchospora pubera]
MSNSEGAGDEEEEEAEDSEEFYESLDRILSSSCSSTSASSDDDSAPPGPHRRTHSHHHRRSSPPSLDVWIAEPAPVEERRRRLLEQLGLSHDPSLTRHTGLSVLGSGRDPEMGRSVSHETYRSSPSVVSIARSRSDSSVDPASSITVNSPPVYQSKPPLVVQLRSASNDSIEVVDEFRERTGGEDHEDESKCLIKDLDNGTEFVVKESRVRELRTGRQLTMEEFELCVGRSPIVQELMRRQRNVEDSGNNMNGDMPGSNNAMDRSGQTNATRAKRRGSWFKGIKSMGNSNRDRRSSDERDTSSEKGGRRSSSATDDSQDGSTHTVHLGPEKAKVRYSGKLHREITGLYMNQAIQAHSGSIWSIEFSLDGRYLASAGEDCVIHVWEVSELDKKGEFFGERENNGSCNPFVAAVTNGSPESGLGLGLGDATHNHWEKKRRARGVGGRKSASLDHIMVPEHVFALSEKPICSFRGHSDDVLDLSWSKSQHLLSSSMDKTVRLWHMESNTCLKIFSHSDYVTCIQFNPVDDRYFISGSLDEKVRIWSIPDRQIVDWTDLHEMVTAACYTPDGQSALVGSHKGSCHMYDTSDNKLLQKSQIDLQNKRKKSTQKKVTGFQFAPGSSSKVLITSADSRIRVIDGVDLVHKFKGFRNTSSQITACISTNGKYVVSASEDSHVYVWRYDDDSEPGRTKGNVVTSTQSYEYFCCQDVTVAVVWPSPSTVGPTLSADQNGIKPNGENNRATATWPEEIVNSRKGSPRNNSNANVIINSTVDIFNSGIPAQTRSAWGMVIVTAGRGGEIRTFQNFGFPVRV